jgi:transcription-repair coupling factor (mfd)
MSSTIIPKEMTEQFAKIFDNSVQNFTISQSTPYFEIEFARFFFAKKQVVISVFPTLYTALHVYEQIETNENIFFFGADEFISAQLLSASPELLLERLNTIEAITINRNQPIWLITHVAAITRPIFTPETYNQQRLTFTTGFVVERAQLLESLVNMGYQRNSIVEKPGHFAVRGDIVDVFSPKYDLPLRLSFFDNDFEFAFTFDIETQLTKERLEKVDITPMTDQLGEELVSIVKFLEDPLILQHQMERITATYDHMCQDALQFSTTDNPAVRYIEYEQVLVNAPKIINFAAVNEGDLSLQATELIQRKQYNLLSFQQTVTEYVENGYHLICLLGENITDSLVEASKSHFALETEITYSTDRHFNEISHTLKTIVIDYYDYLGEKQTAKKQTKIFSHLELENQITHVKDIQAGDYIVHANHGIGHYEGVQTIISQGVEKDYIVLSYQNEEKIYLPTEKISTLYKYVGGKENFVPKLSKIGDKTWKKRKDRVTEHVEAFAQELFTLYMEREQISGFAFGPDTQRQQQFEAAFPYPETKDQLIAISEIKADMEKPFAMERILCGDVGFGKTEVAFRAAFKAMESGKQVVILAPTTILAKQHYENAQNRFKDYGFKVGMLSRLVSKSVQDETIFNTELGEINLLIGTHRLLSKDVVFASLGLVIIDEEHRFGVEAKEKLKKLRTNVDVLLISATPIPRTLQMAVTGIREMSLLQTPPHNRYPVQTYVLEQNDSIVQDAIERELVRGGQTYYLYNKVGTIATMAAKLQKMFPDSVINFAHGQMPKQQLEKIVTAFVEQEIDVLVSTTIIENGMDIPNANTLIVHDADMLGLAQLYQLRGRVGRSERIAYSYFMYHPNHILTEEALKRLQTVQSFTEFGSGYHIAMRDLAIRGAGDVLGKTQSGFINDVGFDLYVDMLQAAIAKQKAPNDDVALMQAATQLKETDVSLAISTYIPSTYIPDESVKIEVYQMLNKITDMEILQKTREILRNRFGKIPLEVESLLYLFLYRTLAAKYHIRYVRQLKNKVIIQYDKQYTKKLNRVALFKILHAQNVEVEYNQDALQIALVTMRKDPLEWLKEIYLIISLIDSQIILDSKIINSL